MQQELKIAAVEVEGISVTHHPPGREEGVVNTQNDHPQKEEGKYRLRKQKDHAQKMMRKPCPESQKGSKTTKTETEMIRKHAREA